MSNFTIEHRNDAGYYFVLFFIYMIAIPYLTTPLELVITLLLNL